MSPGDSGHLSISLRIRRDVQTLSMTRLPQSTGRPGAYPAVNRRPRTHSTIRQKSPGSIRIVPDDHTNLLAGLGDNRHGTRAVRRLVEHPKTKGIARLQISDTIGTDTAVRGRPRADSTVRWRPGTNPAVGRWSGTDPAVENLTRPVAVGVRDYDADFLTGLGDNHQRRASVGRRASWASC